MVGGSNGSPTCARILLIGAGSVMRILSQELAQDLGMGSGHEPWPRLFQNLRASCETDWVERYPAHAVAKWLGRSPKVAAEHYLMSREHYFEDVVTGGRGVGEPDSAAMVVGGQSRQEEPQSCDANCDAIATRNATPHASASESAPSHLSTDVVAAQEVSAGSSGIAPLVENNLLGSTGLEPVTSTV